MGISLEKLYRINKGNKKIIVAVLDTQIDLQHEDLKPSIWVNKKEIPNNGVDDDHNCNVDDIFMAGILLVQNKAATWFMKITNMLVM